MTSGLCDAIYLLTRKNSSNPTKKLAYVFALAAFAQFHFVDIHPYQDGNGRLCRYISKRLLDAVLPFPFPMFRDRAAYIKCLEDGRKKPSADAPELLFKLLIQEALAHYNSLATDALPRYDAFNREVLSTMLDSTLAPERRAHVLQAFEQLSAGESVEVEGVCVQKTKPFCQGGDDDSDDDQEFIDAM